MTSPPGVRGTERGSPPVLRGRVRARSRLSRARSRDLLLLASGFAVTLTVFGRSAWPQYGRADDYYFVYVKHVGLFDEPTRLWVGTGRPVAAWLAQLLLGPVDTMDELKWMRLLGMASLALGVGLVAILVSRIVTEPDRWVVPVVATAVGTASLVSPGATSAATWAIMATQVVALPSALAAGLWVMRRNSPRWATALGTLLLVTVTVCTYQHFVTVALLPALVIAAVRWVRHQSPGLLRILWLGACSLVALGVNYLYVKYSGGHGMDRFADVTFEQRVTWWRGEYLPRTIDIAIPWGWSTVGLSALFLLALLALPVSLGRRYAALPAAVLAAWMATSLIIFPGELWASARLVSPAQLVLWTGAALCAGFTVLEWTAKPTSSAVARRSAMTGVALSVALAAAGGSLSGHRSWIYFAQPESADWRAAVCTMRAQPPLEAGVRVAVSPFGQTTAPTVEYDDYGLIGSSVSWALKPQVWLAELGTSGQPAITPRDIVTVPEGVGTTGSEAPPGTFDFQVRPDACRQLEQPAAPAPGQ